MLTLTDHFGRSIHDLRISITDRCNYKCVYCRTGTNGAAYAELPFDDYLRMARILVGLGITKIRLTGGEPLLRKGIVQFVRDLTQLRTTEGKKPEIALTTNGHLLAEIAQALKTPVSIASPSAWTRSIPNASPASPAFPTDMKAFWQESGHRAAPASIR